ncbi:Murein DD-endopeptidase MepM and murein hydrolase activator NlpD, containing LysM domain [Streptoalloteichus tenebrarius]|uniref:Murein DD-endopeptidase MepM and murein hydrolase activator NlpD, containing LysM domain n=1 Tax=Streptoalloteichus tenebrarius (strain ATCC 17920 / DSM 40477 / JCM 4838 / CBS 697.72 / NBRC 16177 / NCIMB 11028 / NRRL B-12390 / A12253. 1 / ISP 5477) TaxID=1933 RepID=A0ABT1I440_STRSD|nr:M23 family metallopeptidase [Streptoalloteichus tenebrarius]MCP2262493.1 Murein DD-endopeptidase MepM and murein hydrolase activator NlpD, containing LysM domain [Streptoalloteichus tenebrarius]BFE99671.1 M23 family metallopeptidase [Streptoalloteichus tenebrarius]
MRTRVVVAALVAGAFVVGATHLDTVGKAAGEVTPLGDTAQLASSVTRATAPEVLPVAQIADPAADAAELGRVVQIQADQVARVAGEQAAAAEKAAQEARAAAERAAQEAAAKEAAAAAERERAAREAARRPLYVKPAEGVFTSGFGARWGTRHNGVDIANSIGTPVRSVAEGVVVEAGPASGFGLWVRVRHNDGTISVYGHVNEILARAGQHVAAGEQIATMGNRGQSTGPHLHFEVWLNGSQKINPQPWLAERGIQL